MSASFHSWKVSEIEKHLGVDATTGLSLAEAGHRLTKYGRNAFEQANDRDWLKILWRQVNSFFVYLLLAATVISYFIEGLGQTLILVVIIVLNIVLGFIQEYKAERALSELKKNFNGSCRVLRHGQAMTIENDKVVPGDVVLLQAGDKVPADLRLIEEESLRLDESALTGESVPMSKNPETLREKTPLADRRNMLFGSTLVVAGHGKGIVVAVGGETEFGRIAKLVSGDEGRTPLEKQIVYIGKAITFVSALMVAVIILLGFWRGFEILPLLTFALALLVGAVPESLPTVITLSLAVGVVRMAKRRAIVRQLAAVETLGTINIIATDKTGTITNNHLVAAVFSAPSRGKWERYDLEKRSTEIDRVEEALGLALICSSLDLTDSGKYFGDPLEVALAEGAKSVSPKALLAVKRCQRLFEVPFDSDKKYMAVLCRLQGKSRLIVKGMPERVIRFCKLDQASKRRALFEASELSRQGYKVIALAQRKGAATGRSLTGMELFGFFAFVDEPVLGIEAVIDQVKRAGIKPVILTGDHPETARFVANKIGFEVKDDEIVMAPDLGDLTKGEWRNILTKVKVFARVTPEDKIRLVKAWQNSGLIVAMAGDGVNDAPAIKEAQVGIAMGKRGTEVTKSAADIILADDRYSTIIAAIEYGRTIFDNIRNVIIMLLLSNAIEVTLVTIAFVFNLPLPFTALQILWINLITDSLPALALSLEKPTRGVLLEPPRSGSVRGIYSALIYTALLAVIGLILSFWLFVTAVEESPARAQTLVFTFLVLAESVLSLSLRSKKRIWQSPKEFLANRPLLWAIGLALSLQAVIFWKPFRPIFDLVPLNGGDIATLVILSLITFFGAEAARFGFDFYQEIKERKLANYSSPQLPRKAGKGSPA